MYTPLSLAPRPSRRVLLSVFLLASFGSRPISPCPVASFSCPSPGVSTLPRLFLVPAVGRIFQDARVKENDRSGSSRACSTRGTTLRPPFRATSRRGRRSRKKMGSRLERSTSAGRHSAVVIAVAVAVMAVSPWPVINMLAPPIRSRRIRAAGS